MTTRTRPMFVLAASLLFAAAGCIPHSDADAVRGSGKAAKETRQVGAFDAIDVRGAATLDVTVGGAPSVVVEADDNLLPLVVTDVTDHTLQIGTRNAVRSKLDDGIHVTITVPSLRGIEVGGACTAKIAGLTGPVFEVRISGAGSIKADGAVDALRIHVSGSGSIEAEKLAAKRADVDVSGAGHVRLTATEALSAKVSGVGDVAYAGKPQHVEKKVLGIGRIEEI